jgi:hypothetical protein
LDNLEIGIYNIDYKMFNDSNDCVKVGIKKNVKNIKNYFIFQIGVKRNMNKNE